MSFETQLKIEYLLLLSSSTKTLKITLTFKEFNFYRGALIIGRSLFENVCLIVFTFTAAVHVGNSRNVSLLEKCKGVFRALPHIYDETFAKKINPLQANVPFLYPLKTSENQKFSDIFRGYRKGTLAWNGLTA